MDGARFDTIARKFAEIRVSRRSALGTAGVVGLGAVAGSSTSSVGAQADATPEAIDRDSTADVMFVQGYQSGSLTPATDGSETFTLTLEEGLGQTVWFADRPSRDFGSTDTADFVGGFNFSDENPPNAALVTDADGEQEILIVELMTPAYDVENRSVTYQATVLGEMDRGESGELSEPDEIEFEAQDFGVTHLFIDSCPDGKVECCELAFDDGRWRCKNSELEFTQPQGYCWDPELFACYPCDPHGLTAQCNAELDCQDIHGEGLCVSWPNVQY